MTVHKNNGNGDTLDVDGPPWCYPRPTFQFRGHVPLIPVFLSGNQREAGTPDKAQAVSGADSDGTPVRTHSAQNSCFDVQNPALSCNSGDIDGTNKIPVHTGLSANKHGDIRKKEMVPRARIELATRGFSVRMDSNGNGNKDGVSDGAGTPVCTYSAQNSGIDVILEAIRNLPKDERTAILAALAADGEPQ